MPFDGAYQRLAFLNIALACCTWQCNVESWDRCQAKTNPGSGIYPLSSPLPLTNFAI
jgi:hypothetical protein